LNLDKIAWNKAKAARSQGMDGVGLHRKIKDTTSREIDPDVEVLHATQKSRNASVACNAHFLAGYRPEDCLLGLKLMLYLRNME
jgi:hypothetical protein